jgi:hypothetical protein
MKFSILAGCEISERNGSQRSSFTERHYYETG